MATRFENILSQVNGVTDTFTTATPYSSGTLVLGYNGQLYSPGVNIQSEVSPNSFRLTFVPAANTTGLMVVYDDGGGASDDIVALGTPPRP